MPGSLVEGKAMLPYLRAIFQQFFPKLPMRRSGPEPPWLRALRTITRSAPIGEARIFETHGNAAAGVCRGLESVVRYHEIEDQGRQKKACGDDDGDGE
jgi:hypothetical protein